MGLMDGLAAWLRQIIAVILLASIIDLLLPNRTMQRYVRLVAGLFILMTLATPLLNWMKGDFSDKLTEGLNAVERTPQSANQQLAMIEEEGARLRDKRSTQAAELVSARLETAIRSDVERSEQRGVREVNVALERGVDGVLTVAKVVVLLEPETAAVQNGINSAPIKDVEPIAAVDIRIQTERWPMAAEASPSSDNVSVQSVMAEEREEDSDRETRLRISALIASHYGLAASIVEVKQPAAEARN